MSNENIIHTQSATMTPESDTQGVIAKVSCPTLEEVTIKFVATANRSVVSAYSLQILREILYKACLRNLTITSTSRTAADQARIMFEMIEAHGGINQGVNYARRLYNPSTGGKVISVYADLKPQGVSSADIINAMTNKIEEIGPRNVSRHIADPTVVNVIDVAPSSISSAGRFEHAVKADLRVAVFLKPPHDPSYHLEIPQSQH